MSKVIIWEVWCSPDDTYRFFGTKQAAECHIHKRYNVILHPDDHWHSQVRENYGGLRHHHDGYNIWIAWTRKHTIHLMRHEIEATPAGLAHAMNALAKKSRHLNIR